MNLEDIKQLIDENRNSYPNMSWLVQVTQFFSEKYQLIPLNQGVYKGTSDEEVKNEKKFLDLKGTGVDNWEQYSFSKSPYIPTGDKYGIVCGPGINGNGIIVLDIDNLEDFKSFCSYNNISSEYNTFTVETRQNRYHYYFLYPNDGKEYHGKIKGESGVGFDVRAFKNYVLGPGSINPISKTVYRIISTAPIAPCPEWLKKWSLERPKSMIPTVKEESSFDPVGISFPLSLTAGSTLATPVPVGSGSPLASFKITESATGASASGSDSASLPSTTKSELVAPVETTSPATVPTYSPQVVLKEETVTLLRTPSTDGYKSEPLVLRAIDQMLWQGCTKDQIIYEIMSAPLGIVVKENGPDWLSGKIESCQKFVKEAIDKSKNKKLDMTNELYNTMLELEYYEYGNGKEFYAKVYKDNGNIDFYNIKNSEFSGYIINRQSVKTGRVGTPNNLKMALMRLDAYVKDHSKPIDKICRFHTIGDSLVFNLGRKSGECIEITPNRCSIILRPNVIIDESADLLPIENIDMSATDLSSTAKFLDLLGVTDECSRHYLTILCVSYLFSKISKPILLLVGDCHAGKTSFAYALKGIWDPARDDERGGAVLPEKVIDLAILLNSQGVALIDNFSELQKSIQNTLCSAFSSGYFPTRTLYKTKSLEKIPLRSQILMTSLDIPSKLRSDLVSRMNFYEMSSIKTYITDADIEKTLKDLYPRIRGELCNLASRILPLMNKYRPTSLKRHADFDILCQAYFEAIGDKNPVESYNKVLKDRLTKDCIAVADKELVLKTFVEIVHSEDDCMLFTMEKMLEEICKRLPQKLTADITPSSLSRYLNSYNEVLNSLGIVMFKGGKDDNGKYNLAGTVEALKEKFGDDFEEKLTNKKSLIIKWYNQMGINEAVDQLLLN